MRLSQTTGDVMPTRPQGLAHNYSSTLLAVCKSSSRLKMDRLHRGQARFKSIASQADITLWASTATGSPDSGLAKWSSKFWISGLLQLALSDSSRPCQVGREHRHCSTTMDNVLAKSCKGISWSVT